MPNNIKLILISLSSICAAYATYKFFTRKKTETSAGRPPKNNITIIYSEILESSRKLYDYAIKSKEKYKSERKVTPAFYDQLIDDFRTLIKKVEEQVLQLYKMPSSTFHEGLYAYKDDEVISEIDQSFKIMEHLLRDQTSDEFKFPSQLTSSAILSLHTHISDQSPDIVKRSIKLFEDNEKMSVKKALVTPKVDLYLPAYNKIRDDLRQSFLDEELSKLKVSLDDYKLALKVYGLQPEFLQNYTVLAYRTEKRLKEELELIMFEDVVVPDNLTRDYLLNLNDLVLENFNDLFDSNLKSLLSRAGTLETKAEIFKSILADDESYIMFIRKFMDQCQVFRTEKMMKDRITPTQGRVGELRLTRGDQGFEKRIRDYEERLNKAIQEKMKSLTA